MNRLKLRSRLPGQAVPGRVKSNGYGTSQGTITNGVPVQITDGLTVIRLSVGTWSGRVGPVALATYVIDFEMGANMACLAMVSADEGA